MRRLAALLILFLVAANVLAWRLRTDAASRKVERPSVVVFSMCSMRADHVGALGSKLGLTPSIDRVARRGVVFEHAYTQGMWTRVSQVALLTGRYSADLGLATVLPATSPSLAEVLGAAGFQSAAFTGGGNLAREYGFSRGFDVYNEYFDGGLRASVAGSLAWLDHKWDRSRAFFLFVQNYDAHPPCACSAPSDPFARDAHMMASQPFKILDDVYYAKLQNGSDLEEPRRHPERYGAMPISAGIRDHMLADYRNAVRTTDAAFGRLMAGLEARGLDERTIVVVLGDHGWDLFEKRRFCNLLHGYQGIAHVPLVLSGPGLPRGERVGDDVGLIDVAPTLLQLLAIAAPDYQGRSLVPLIDRAPDRPRTWAISPTEDRVWVRMDGYELVASRSGQSYELYELSSDPQEAHNRYGDPALRAPQAMLMAKYRESAAGPAPVSTGSPAETDETRAFLRKHGYW